MKNGPQIRADSRRFNRADELRSLSMHNRLEYLANTRPPGYSDEFYTPDKIVRSLGKFDLDPCAGPKAHARVNIRRPDCGLASEWHGRVWLNPPYLHIHDWIEKFIAHGNGIALFNARCETRWFQNLAANCDALLFPRGRIVFERPDSKRGRGPVGSVLLAIGTRNATALERSGIDGLYFRVPNSEFRIR